MVRASSEPGGGLAKRFRRHRLKEVSPPADIRPLATFAQQCLTRDVPRALDYGTGTA
jgi:hypothetical protein